MTPRITIEPSEETRDKLTSIMANKCWSAKVVVTKAIDLLHRREFPVKTKKGAKP